MRFMDITVHSECCGLNVFMYSNVSYVRFVNESRVGSFNESVEPVHWLAIFIIMRFIKSSLVLFIKNANYIKF